MAPSMVNSRISGIDRLRKVISKITPMAIIPPQSTLGLSLVIMVLIS